MAGYNLPTCEGLTTGSIACSAPPTCAAGYHGTPTEDQVTCDSHGAELSVAGCEPDVCIAPSQQAGYNLPTCESMQNDNIQCSALPTCAAGYHGFPAIDDVTCTAHAVELTLSGCSPNICIAATTPVTGYNLPTCEGLTTGSIACSAPPACAAGYHGTPTTTCSTDGAELSVAGCEPDVCTVPMAQAGYILPTCESMAVGAIQCSVPPTCTSGYHGTATAECSGHGSELLLSGCEVNICTGVSAVAGYTTPTCDLSSYSGGDLAISTDCSVHPGCAAGYYLDNVSVHPGEQWMFTIDSHPESYGLGIECETDGAAFILRGCAPCTSQLGCSTDAATCLDDSDYTTKLGCTAAADGYHLQDASGEPAIVVPGERVDSWCFKVYESDDCTGESNVIRADVADDHDEDLCIAGSLAWGYAGTISLDADEVEIDLYADMADCQGAPMPLGICTVETLSGTCAGHDGQSTVLGPSAMSFEAAEAHCVSIGGHLAAFHNEAEHLALAEVCFPDDASQYDYMDDCWIGLNKRDGEAFSWTDGSTFNGITGSRTSSPPCAASECDIAHAVDSRECVLMEGHYADGTVEGEFCSEARRFICQCDGDVVETLTLTQDSHQGCNLGDHNSWGSAGNTGGRRRMEDEEESINLEDEGEEAIVVMKPMNDEPPRSSHDLTTEANCLRPQGASSPVITGHCSCVMINAGDVMATAGGCRRVWTAVTPAEVISVRGARIEKSTKTEFSTIPADPNEEWSAGTCQPHRDIIDESQYPVSCTGTEIRDEGFGPEEFPSDCATLDLVYSVKVEDCNLSPDRAPPPTYDWQALDFTQCTETCGVRAAATREVKCMGTTFMGVAFDADSAGLCEEADMPSTTQACDAVAEGGSCDDGIVDTMGDVCIADDVCQGKVQLKAEATLPVNLNDLSQDALDAIGGTEEELNASPLAVSVKSSLSTSLGVGQDSITIKSIVAGSVVVDYAIALPVDEAAAAQEASATAASGGGIEVIIPDTASATGNAVSVTVEVTPLVSYAWAEGSPVCSDRDGCGLAQLTDQVVPMTCMVNGVAFASQPDVCYASTNSDFNIVGGGSKPCCWASWDNFCDTAHSDRATCEADGEGTGVWCEDVAADYNPCVDALGPKPTVRTVLTFSHSA